MAEDTREVVYYKGKSYYTKDKKEDSILIEIEDTSFSNVTRIVEKSNVLTLEQFEKLKDSRRSEHQMYIPSQGGSKR